MSKFLSQKRKKRKFHGNRFTNRQTVDDEESVVVESTSSKSKDDLSDDQNDAKESSASYRKFNQLSKRRNLNQI